MKIGVLFHSHPSAPTWSHTRFLREVGRVLVQGGDRYLAFYPSYEGSPQGSWEGIETVPVPFSFEGRNSRLAELRYPRHVARMLDGSYDAVIQTADLGGRALFARCHTLGILGVDWFQGVAPKFLADVQREGLRGRWGLALERFFLPRFERRHARSADVVIAPSRRNRQYLLELYGLDPSRVHVLPNGFDPVAPITPQERSEARTSLGLKGGRFYASFVGVDWYRKGLDVLRDAVGIVRSRGIRWTILNVGNEKSKSGAEIGYGWKDGAEKRAILAASDAFVFPTRYEGSPLPIPEAAGLGLPIVTTPDASVDQGTPGVDYVEVPKEDPKALADALEWLATHPAESRAMAEHARTVFLNWTWEDQAKELRRLLVQGSKELASSPRGSARGATRPVQDRPIGS